MLRGVRVATETRRHGALLPEQVGEGATRRLLAPLPLAGWRDALEAAAGLGLTATELQAGWLSQGDTPEVAAASATHGVRLVALNGSLDQLLSLGAAALRPWTSLGIQHLVVSECSDAATELIALSDLAGELGVTALLTNAAGGWPDSADLGRLASDRRYPSLGACYDPAAAVARRRHPYLADMMAGPLKRAVRILRLRDALFDGREVLPDKGNAELRELVSALEARTYRGWYALSPVGEGPYPVRLAAAHAAVTTMLDEL